eukprot:TRINITY_DN2569_c1_g1_i1.p2 TRINITY_DN2569_c1_g1~~TRINITY_DN2569_c1_g1_i1.p2  ORF type:complete len:207 (+),score=46.74 TRINITY_DN2569_c1_g1_i1:72-623(+)
MGDSCGEVLQIKFESMPERYLSCLLFKNVTNAAEIRKKIVGQQLPIDYSFIDAAILPSTLVLNVAAYKAILNHKQHKKQTNTIHSELVYFLSPSKHIADSLKRYGVNDNTTSLIVARFEATDEEIQKIKQIVQGEQVGFSELEKLQDLQQIRKAAKISDEEMQISGLTDAILFRIAAKECLKD